MKKRLYKVMIVLGVLLLGLAGRLAYIQILGHEDLAQAAAAQQLIALEGANSRGMIYDRNQTPLVGNNREYIFIIQEKNFDGEAMNALSALSAEEIKNGDNGYRVFASKQYHKDLGQRLIRNSSAYIIEAGRRYSKQQKAVHILGYVNPQDSSGAAGIELMCDEELSLLNKRIFTTADVRGRIIPGRGLVVKTNMDRDSYVKKGVVTTLDTGLQGAAEEILKSTDRNGAIVVLKSRTGELVASASTPDFDPSNVKQYMESNSDELVNKVTQGEYPPGSVFKIAVAAAALEQGIPLEKNFFCKGYSMINGQRVNCKTGGETGHGTITLKEAFAQSCNSAFIQLGQELGADEILDMAGRLGLGKRALEAYPQEKNGNLMTPRQSSGAAIANLAIGQGETLVTPLQVAHMTNIIAAGGVDPGIFLLQENQLKEKGEEEQVLSKETAQGLSEMMAQTMITGSGKSLASEAVGVSMAAKTGSAESYMGDREVVHGWITGFVPAGSPEYTITVFIEAGESGSQSAGPLFVQMAQYLRDSGSFEDPVNF